MREVAVVKRIHLNMIYEFLIKLIKNKWKFLKLNWNFEKLLDQKVKNKSKRSKINIKLPSYFFFNNTRQISLDSF